MLRVSGSQRVWETTTARLLLDFIRTTRGGSRVLGGSGDPAVRQRAGYLPSDLNLPRSMTGSDAFRYFGALGRGVDRAQVERLCQRFVLNPDRPFRELSTGNRRKVGLILATSKLRDVGDAPAGELRWIRMPSQPLPWSGILAAISYS